MYLTILAILLSTLTCTSHAEIISIPKLYNRVVTTEHSHKPLITGESFRSLATHVIDARRDSIDTDKIAPGDIIFLDRNCLDFFAKKVFDKISVPFFLVTGNGSGTVPSDYRYLLENKKIIKWYARNIDLPNHPKLVVIPLGFPWFKSDSVYAIYNKIVSSIESNFKHPKKYLCSANFRCSTRGRDRMPCIRYIVKNSSYITLFSNQPLSVFLDTMKDSYFVISPRGANIDCYRHWEALCCGAYPIIQHSTIDKVFEDLPVVLINDWEEISEEFLQKKIKEFSKQKFNLSKLRFEYWENLILSEQQSYLKKVSNTESS